MTAWTRKVSFLVFLQPRTLEKLETKLTAEDVRWERQKQKTLSTTEGTEEVL
ncbi:MAG: hypothetical protein JW971_04320 [Synergistales bacterium]|nr:hypothetical protein [Synergistales bacterium]